MVLPSLRKSRSILAYPDVADLQTATMMPAKTVRPRTILQIVPSLDAGGAERTTIDIARALAAAGYRPLVASEGGRLEEELAAAGGELLRLPLDTKQPLNLLANARTLAKLMTAENVAIIHARSRAPAWSALLAARRTGVPFVTTYHGIYNARTPLKRWYNSVMARGDAVIANSQWTADHILASYSFRPRLLAVIPRGIDLSAFNPTEVDPVQVRSLRQNWGIPENERVILLPGRLTRWKGHLIFIQALGKLRRAGKLEGVRAIILGDAQGRNDYVAELAAAVAQEALQDAVMICAHVSAMPPAYAAADIVLSASTDPEAFGRVPPEAAAMARPVIATDHGGARETVLAGISGLLVTPRDSGAMASAIADLLSRSPDRLVEMGEAGRAHIRANYSLERMQSDTLALYESLLARSIAPAGAAQ